MRALVALLLAVAVSGCGDDGPGPVGEGPDSIGDPPSSVGVGVGETVAFSMYTHCGVESAQINGPVWNAVEPLYSSPEKLGPPRGWGNPQQDGKLTLESKDRAVFAALGQQVVLVPSESNEPLRPCDELSRPRTLLTLDGVAAPGGGRPALRHGDYRPPAPQ